MINTGPESVLEIIVQINVWLKSVTCNPPMKFHGARRQMYHGVAVTRRGNHHTSRLRRPFACTRRGRQSPDFQDAYPFFECTTRLGQGGDHRHQTFYDMCVIMVWIDHCRYGGIMLHIMYILLGASSFFLCYQFSISVRDATVVIIS